MLESEELSSSAFSPSSQANKGKHLHHYAVYTDFRFFGRGALGESQASGSSMLLLGAASDHRSHCGAWPQPLFARGLHSSSHASDSQSFPSNTEPSLATQLVHESPTMLSVPQQSACSAAGFDQHAHWKAQLSESITQASYSGQQNALTASSNLTMQHGFADAASAFEPSTVMHLMQVRMHLSFFLVVQSGTVRCISS